MPSPFILVSPATRGLSLALTRHFLLSTNLPVIATHRNNTSEEVKQQILDPLSADNKNDNVSIDPSRLHLVTLDLLSESSIKSASDALSDLVSSWDQPYLKTGFFTGGMLYPEKKTADLDLKKIEETFQLNLFSHMMLIKHFSQFLPTRSLASHSLSDSSQKQSPLALAAKWVHVSARVGSISDNQRGGWYSYRSSKAALNQVIKTFDRQLQMEKSPAICVGVHPGTMKTELSRDFWESVPSEKLFEPEVSAEKLVSVVDGLQEAQRGRVWDWKGDEVLP